ncbi:MAG: hypothetical protein IPJ71_09715 [Bdellovibrionales bacterium]|nr:hypothetical protein [Bdellovibrionales bacterium]
MKIWASTSNALNSGQKGQSVVEAVLLAIVLLGITMFVSNFFKKEELIRKIISGPWQNLAGMIQNGVWAQRSASMQVHPNVHRRHVSVKGAAAK